jgi:plastocyanin
VGQPLAEPIRVLVTQDGQPLAGATVTWSTTAVGATLDPATTATDNSGAATNTWTLGTAAGAQTAQASLSGASGSPVTFNATAVADVAASLSKLAGDQQEGPINTALPAPVQAKVSDQFGNGVPGVPVSWSASGAAVSAASVATDAAGTSAVTVTLGGVEGPITITADAPALSGSPQIFSATAGPPAPVAANVQVANNSFSPSSLTIAAGTEVVWTWTPTAVQHNVVPDVPGSDPVSSGPPTNAPATYRYTFNTPGTYRYYCAVHGAPGGVNMSGTVIVQ